LSREALRDRDLRLSRLEAERETLLSLFRSRLVVFFLPKRDFSGLDLLRDWDRFFSSRRFCLDLDWLDFSGSPKVPAGISIPANRANVIFLSDSEIRGWPFRFLASFRSISSFSLCLLSNLVRMLPPSPPPRLEFLPFLFFFRLAKLEGGGVRVLSKKFQTQTI
jgi:hypothetical protein